MKTVRLTIAKQKKLGMKILRGKAVKVQPRGALYSPRGTAVSPIS